MTLCDNCKGNGIGIEGRGFDSDPEHIFVWTTDNWTESGYCTNKILVTYKSNSIKKKTKSVKQVTTE